MRVLFVDDEASVRWALHAFLARQPGIEVLGGVGSSRELLSRLQEGCPDLVLLDWELADSVAATLLSQLRKTCPRMAVIALSGRPEARPAALAAGADAFVSKVDTPELLQEALRSVHQVTEQEGSSARKEKGSCTRAF